MTRNTTLIDGDDTTISYSTDYRTAPQTLSYHVQNDINQMMQWIVRRNSIILNEKKTKSMIVTGKQLDKKNGSIKRLVYCRYG